MIFKLFYNLVKHTQFGALGSSLRCYCLRKQGCKIGKNTFIGPNVTIVNPSNINIGNNVSIHQDCYLDGTGGISIHDNVSIAHQVSIISFNHNYLNPAIPIKRQGISCKSIKIEEDIWIGCKTVILPGTHLKKRSVIAALSLCNREYIGNEVIGGIPANHIKDI